MHRSGNDFVYIASLTPTRHAYKFIVDDDWRFAPDQSTVADAAGNINNVIDLAGFSADAEAYGGGPPVSASRRDSLAGIPYGHDLPDEDEYTKDPPLLPPQLRQIILNAAALEGGASEGGVVVTDPSLVLPAPCHVTLNHLYCTAIKDGLMVQAVTQRYRRKYVTTILYTLLPPGMAIAAQMQGGGAAAAASDGDAGGRTSQQQQMQGQAQHRQ